MPKSTLHPAKPDKEPQEQEWVNCGDQRTEPADEDVTAYHRALTAQDEADGIFFVENRESDNENLPSEGVQPSS
jgi:hypothetical protein